MSSSLMMCLNPSEEHTVQSLYKEMIDACPTTSVLYGGDNVILGCFGNGRVVGHPVKGLFNQHGHTILKRHAVPSWQWLIRDFLSFPDTKLSSWLCKNYLEKEVVAERLSVMAWPGQSPDLNPRQTFGKCWRGCGRKSHLNICKNWWVEWQLLTWCKWLY